MASFFNTIKKLIKNDPMDDDLSDDYDFPRGSKKSNNNNSSSPLSNSGGSGSSSSTELLKHIYQPGIKGTVTSMTFDNVQNTLAIGFNDGVFKVFGSFGNEIVLKSISTSSVRKIIPIINTQHIVIVTENSIEKWDYQERKPIYSLNFKNRITAISSIYGVPYLYIATDTGIIQIYNINNNFLSSYQISLNNNDNNTNTNNNNNQQVPYATNIKVSPEDNNLLLIGWSNGLVLIWNLECKRIEKSIGFLVDKERSYISSLCWSRKGSKFLVGTLNGEIFLFNIQKLNEQPSLVFRSAKVDNSTLQPNNNNYTPIDQLEWLYTKDKKILLFRGVFQGNNKSLMLVKGDNFKDMTKLSTVMVQTNINQFTSVTSLPFSNNGDLLGLMMIDQNNQLFETRFNSKTNTFFDILPTREIDIKSRLHDSESIEMMETYEQCSTDLLNILTSRCQPTFIQRSNLNSLSNNIFKLLITIHSDNYLIFWNITDVKSIQYLYHFQVTTPNNNNNSGNKFIIQSFSFSPKTNTLIISLNNSNNVQIYQISDSSIRIQNSIFQIKDNKIAENLIQSQPQSTNTDNLPQPTFEISKYFSSIQLPVESETISSIILNPYKNSDAIRVVLGSSQGRIYHLIITFKDNRGEVDASSKMISYLEFQYIGSTGQLDGVGVIKNLVFCFVPLRENEDISIIHYSSESGSIGIIDLVTLSQIYQFNTNNQNIHSLTYLSKKSSEKLQYIFLNFDKYLDIDNNNTTVNNNTTESLNPPLPNSEVTTTTTTEVTNTTSSNGIGKVLKADDVNLLVFSGKEIVIYNVPLSILFSVNNSSNLSKSQQQQISQQLEHKRLYKTESKVGYIKSFFVVNNSLNSKSNGEMICSMDINGQLNYYSTSNLETSSPSKTLVGSIIKLPIGNNSNKLVITSDQQILLSILQQCYSVVCSGSMANRIVSIYQPDIKSPSKPQTSTLTKLLFARAPPKLDDLFLSEGTTPPTPTSIDTNPNSSNNNNRQLKFFADDFERIKQALNERGEKLNDLADKTNQMHNAAQQFTQMAKSLNKNR